MAAAGAVAVASAIASTRPVALVTGSTDGIGRLTAQLLSSDYKVLLHGRAQSRLEETRDGIMAENKDAEVEMYCYDLGVMSGARGLADDVLAKYDKLDIVVQNAGVFMPTQVTTADNLEMTFAVNVVAPFILSKRLMPALGSGSRLLMVSSISQSDGGRLDLSDLQFAKRGFDSFRTYGQSKLCMAMLAHEIAVRTSPSTGPVVLSCDPGTVNTKMLLAGWGRCGIEVRAATDEFNLVKECRPEAHGKYFVGCRESRCSLDVYDADKRKTLWDILEAMTKK
jgi:NAD(P)-dependent dehydrogenase (short-subunit alcohol dehydrogenase family)